MKKNILGLTAVLALIAGPVYAGHGDMDAGEWLDTMKMELSLNDQQVNDIKPVLDHYKDQMEAAKKEKHNKLDQILTSEQNDRMKAYKDEQEKMYDKMEDAMEKK